MSANPNTAEPDGNPYQSPALRPPALKRQRKRLCWGLVLILYIITWAGGWLTHARDLTSSAWAKYRLVEGRNAEEQRLWPGGEAPIYDRLREGGPATGVNWAVPLLPGILLADSYEVLGPLIGRGSTKLVLYYGCGTVVVCELWGWVA